MSASAAAAAGGGVAVAQAGLLLFAAFKCCSAPRLWLGVGAGGDVLLLTLPTDPLDTKGLKRRPAYLEVATPDSSNT